MRTLFALLLVACSTSMPAVDGGADAPTPDAAHSCESDCVPSAYAPAPSATCTATGESQTWCEGHCRVWCPDNLVPLSGAVGSDVYCAMENGDPTTVPPYCGLP